jgi:hypothetical protein
MLNPPVRTDWVSTNKDSEFTRYRINLQTGDITASHFPNQAKHSVFREKICPPVSF